jgi:hypothetical protein
MPDRRQRRLDGGILLPALLILIGVVALLVNLGWISPTNLARLLSLWPLLLIVLGILIVINRLVPQPAAGVISLLVVGAALIGAIAFSAVGGSFTKTLTAARSDTVGSLKSATLDFQFGGASIRIQSAQLGEQLYQARFTYPSSEQAPTVDLDRTDGTLTVRSANSGPNFLFTGGQRSAEITLNNSLPWAVSMGSGAADTNLDLRNGQVSSVDLSGGLSNLRLTLPRPKGTVSVNVSGGLSNLTMHAPRDSAWHVHVSGGVSSVTINGSSRGGLGGDYEQQSPNFSTAGDRFDVEISGGASNINFSTDLS